MSNYWKNNGEKQRDVKVESDKIKSWEERVK